MKDTGSTVIIPRKQELSMAGSTVHRVASSTKGRTQEKSQQVYRHSQDKNEDSKWKSVLPQCLYRGRQVLPESASASWPCQSEAAFTPPRWLYLSLTPLSSSKTSRGNMRNCLLSLGGPEVTLTANRGQVFFLFHYNLAQRRRAS